MIENLGSSSPSPKAKNKGNPLLPWVKTQLEPYPKIQIDNFASSWKDGKAFLALVHRACPNSFSYDQEVKVLF